MKFLRAPSLFHLGVCLYLSLVATRNYCSCQKEVVIPFPLGSHLGSHLVGTVALRIQRRFNLRVNHSTLRSYAVTRKGGNPSKRNFSRHMGTLAYSPVLLSKSEFLDLNKSLVPRSRHNQHWEIFHGKLTYHVVLHLECNIMCPLRR